MPCRRHSSPVSTPASDSFRMAMICSSLNRLFLTTPPPALAGHRKWRSHIPTGLIFGGQVRRRFPPPPVKQTPEPKLFIPFMPAPHLPVADPDDLRRLPPPDLLRQRPQNHFLYLHRPLHRGLRVREHAFHALLPSPPAK